MIDEVARRGIKKVSSRLTEAETRMQTLEKAMEALEAAYAVSIAEHSGSSC